MLSVWILKKRRRWRTIITRIGNNGNEESIGLGWKFDCGVFVELWQLNWFATIEVDSVNEPISVMFSRQGRLLLEQ